MSRVTLHIKYELPTEGEFVQLWDVLSSGMGLSVSNNLTKTLLDKYNMMSGRDIRNLLKDIKKCYKDSKVVTPEMIEELEEFLPFIKLKNQ